MATPAADVVLRGKDEASRVIAQVAANLDKLKSVAGLAQSGLLKLGAAGGAIFAIESAFSALNSVVNQLTFQPLGQELNRLTQSTGASVAQIQTLEQAFHEFGLAESTATTALSRLNNAIGQNDPVLKQLGITSRNSYEAMLQLSDVFQTLGDDAEQTAAVTQLMGRGMVDSAAVIRDLRGVTEELGEEMGRLGAYMTDDVVKGSLEVHEALHSMQFVLTALHITLGQALLPTLVEITSSFTEFAEENLDTIKQFVEGTGRFIQQLVILIPNTLDKLSKFFLQYQLIVAETARVTAVASQGIGGQLTGTVKGGPQVELFNEVLRISQEIDEVNKRIHERDARFTVAGLIPGGLGEAGRVRATGEEIPTEETAAAEAEARRRLPPKPEKAKKQPESDREKQIKEIVRLLGIAQTAAAKFTDELIRIENVAATDKLKVELRPVIAALPEKELRELTDSIERAALPKVPITGIFKEDPALRQSIASEMAKLQLEDITTIELTLQPRVAPPPVPPPIGPFVPVEEIEAAEEANRRLIASVQDMNVDVVFAQLNWMALAEEMLTTMAIADAAFASLAGGLEAGFSQVFANLSNQAQTFRTAIQTIFRAIADAALRELARIAAAKVFLFIVKLFGLSVSLPTTALAAAADFIPEAPLPRGGTKSAERPREEVRNLAIPPLVEPPIVKISITVPPPELEPPTIVVPTPEPAPTAAQPIRFEPQLELPLTPPAPARPITPAPARVAPAVVPVTRITITPPAATPPTVPPVRILPAPVPPPAPEPLRIPAAAPAPRIEPVRIPAPAAAQPSARPVPIRIPPPPAAPAPPPVRVTALPAPAPNVRITIPPAPPTVRITRIPAVTPAAPVRATARIPAAPPPPVVRVSIPAPPPPVLPIPRITLTPPSVQPIVRAAPAPPAAPSVAPINRIAINVPPPQPVAPPEVPEPPTIVVPAAAAPPAPVQRVHPRITVNPPELPPLPALPAAEAPQIVVPKLPVRAPAPVAPTTVINRISIQPQVSAPAVKLPPAPTIPAPVVRVRAPNIPAPVSRIVIPAPAATPAPSRAPAAAPIRIEAPAAPAFRAPAIPAPIIRIPAISPAPPIVRVSVPRPQVQAIVAAATAAPRTTPRLGTSEPIRAASTSSSFTNAIDALTRALQKSQPKTPTTTSDQRTFVIQAIDAQNVVASLLLPNGGMRRAGDKVATAGSY